MASTSSAPPPPPPPLIETILVDLSDEAKEVYDEIIKNKVKGNMDFTSKTFISKAEVAIATIHLRKLCSDVRLLDEENWTSQNEKFNRIQGIGRMPELEPILANLEREKQECMVCLELPTNILTTICGHAFCRKCMRHHFEIVRERDPDGMIKCPLCNRELSPALLSSPEGVLFAKLDPPVSKHQHLMERLVEDSNQRRLVVVISRFLGLQKFYLEEGLLQRGFEILVCNEKEERIRNIIYEFQNKEGPAVLLLDLRKLNDFKMVGAYFPRASRVYFLEACVESFEETALSLVHRKGQKEEVKMIKFVTKNTFEERVLLLQKHGIHSPHQTIDFPFNDQLFFLYGNLGTKKRSYDSFINPDE